MTFKVLANETIINSYNSTDGLHDTGTGTKTNTVGALDLDSYVYGDNNGLLLDAGPFTLTINGAVYGAGTGGDPALDGAGIRLTDTNATYLSIVNVSATGDAYGGMIGIYTAHATNVTNAGNIVGVSAGIGIDATGSLAFTINNALTGLIMGGEVGISISDAHTGLHTITNAGTIIGYDYDGDVEGMAIDTSEDSTSIDKVTNSGTLGDATLGTYGLGGSVALWGGDDSFSNTGKVYGNVAMGDALHGDGNDTFSNTGRVSGNVYMGDGTNTFTNSGTIGNGQYDSINSVWLDGIVELGAAIDKFTNSGTISTLVDTGGANVIANTGTIRGDIELGDGADTVTTSKVVTGYIDLGEGSNKLTASGTIGGDIWAGDGTDVVTSSGTVGGDVLLSEGQNSFANTGVVSGDIVVGSGSDTVSTTKTLGGNVILGDGANKLTASGTIGGYVEGGAATDAVTNSAVISGYMALKEGANTLTNSGKILGDNGSGDGLTTGSGVDTITNSGTITKDVRLGEGADLFTNSGAGSVGGIVYLGDGNDKFVGGTANDVVMDDAGADSVLLGGGDKDRYIATWEAAISDGNDVVDGGIGLYDEYDASLATSAVYINLDVVSTTSKTHIDNAGSGFTSIEVANATAYGADVSDAVSTVAKDTITGFENAQGGSEADFIFGSAANNVLTGNAGNDLLVGYAGSDTLKGGDGDDRLLGGLGKDLLYGGDGADIFSFLAVTDSGLTAATRDVIYDFAAGDQIDFTGLAATYGTLRFYDGSAADGLKFHGKSGDVRAILTSTSTIVQIDFTGDYKADFTLELKGHQALSSSDFLGVSAG